MNLQQAASQTPLVAPRCRARSFILASAPAHAAANDDGTGDLNRYSSWFDVRDGKIARVREYLDKLYAQQVLFDAAGVAPKQH